MNREDELATQESVGVFENLTSPQDLPPNLDASFAKQYFTKYFDEQYPGLSDSQKSKLWDKYSAKKDGSGKIAKVAFIKSIYAAASFLEEYLAKK